MKVQDAEQAASSILFENGQSVTPEAFAEAGLSAYPAPTTEAETWKVGNIVEGRYKVRGELGEGGMGKVYHVYDTVHDLDLAMKTVRRTTRDNKPLTSDELAKLEGHFIQEALAWVGLGMHLNIVTCYYVRRVAGSLRIFIEYVPGGTLANWLSSDRVIDAATALDIGIQICWGAGWAHKRGQIHLDIKPDNILMFGDSTPQVTDFGLIRPLRETSEQTQEPNSDQATTRAAIIDGTKGYGAPEQWKPNATIAMATDVYALGVVLCDLLRPVLGFKKPHPRAESSVYKYNLKTRSLACILPDDAYTQLVKVLQRCLDDTPANRYPDALALAEALQAVYVPVVGQDYLREMPPEIGSLADGLNNKAFSLFELSEQETDPDKKQKLKVEAEQAWKQALEVDPTHPDTTYNLGLSRWQGSRQTDEEFVRQLATVVATQANDWRPHYLLGRVHLERGEEQAAKESLKEAAQMAPKEREREVQNAMAHIGQAVPAQYVLFFKEHMGDVHTVALTPDGHRAISGGEDKTLRMWNLESGHCLHTFKGHEDWVTKVAFTLEGRYILSGSLDKTVRMWSVESGHCLRVMEGHTEGVNAIVLSPDKTHFVSGGRDKTLRMWDLESGRCLSIIKDHVKGVGAIAITPDGSRAVSGDGPMLKVWDLASGRCLRTLEEHMGGVRAIAITPDGRCVVSGSSDKTLRLWDLGNGCCLRTFEGHRLAVSALALTQDGRRIISGSVDNTLRLWDLESGRCLRTFEGHGDWIVAIFVTLDKHYALSASLDKTLRRWDLEGIGRIAGDLFLSRPPGKTVEVSQDAVDVQNWISDAQEALDDGRPLDAVEPLRQAREKPGYERNPKLLDLLHKIGHQIGERRNLLVSHCLHILEGHTNTVTAVALTPDNKRAVSASYDKTLRVWDFPSGHCLHTLEGHTGEVYAVALTPDGQRAVSRSRDATLRVWDLENGRHLHTIERQTNSVGDIALTPDGHYVVSENSGGALGVWDLSNGHCLHILKERYEDVEAFTVTMDGRYIVSVGSDLRVWDLTSGRCLRTMEGRRGGVRSVALTPDGRYAVSGNIDSTLQVWDLASGRCLRTMVGHKDVVDSIALSPNGRYAVSTGLDKALRVWDLASGRCLHTFWHKGGLFAPIWATALTSDGRYAVSGSDDRTLRLWDLINGRCLHIMEGHRLGVRTIALTPDGRYVVSGSGDSTLRVWELNWDYDFPEPRDWDDQARPYLEVFLTLHTPYSPDGISRVGKPIWTEDDLRELVKELALRGYGWLRPGGVRHELERIARNWRGPPSLF